MLFEQETRVTSETFDHELVKVADKLGDNPKSESKDAKTCQICRAETILFVCSLKMLLHWLNESLRQVHFRFRLVMLVMLVMQLQENLNHI